MADEEQLAILRQGVEVWNAWRIANPDMSIDLSGVITCSGYFTEANFAQVNFSNAILDGAFLLKANLSGANLTEANLSGANLSMANLSGANLTKANLKEATLRNTNLSEAILINAFLVRAELYETILIQANLTGAILSWANLSKADLTEADLTEVDLRGAILIGTNLSKSTLTRCHIYGISAWDVNLSGIKAQIDLSITPDDQPAVTVDNLEVAQFIYLLLTNATLRDTIATIGRKAVLILGRFADERKVVLDRIKDALRARGYCPILFDFPSPDNRNTTETVQILARLSRFVIADVTAPRCIPYELAMVVPTLHSVPIRPIIQSDETIFGMGDDLLSYPWFLPVYRYEDTDALLADFDVQVITPAEAKVNELITAKRI